MAGLIISVGLLVSVSVCISGIVGEPHCSPFHYHEQLLERMIEVKYKMDALTGKMDEWEKTVAEKLGKMDDNFKQLESRLTERVENHQTNINNTITEKLEKMEESLKQNEKLETKLIEEANNRHSFLNSTLADILEESEKWKQNVEDKVKTPLVLFKTRNVANRSPKAGDTVVLQTVVQNEGSGYDINTGIFTAPVSGTYLFTAQFCLNANKQLSVQIVANGEVVTAAQFGDSKWGGICASTDGMAILEQGEESKVRITYASSGTVIFSDSNPRWSYFSGVLINK